MIANLILDTWDKQAKIVSSLAEAISKEMLGFQPAPGETTVAFHLCHICEVRWYWLNQVAKERAASLGDVFTQEGDSWVPISDLPSIREQLHLGATAIREEVAERLAGDLGPAGPYDSPVHFLQHMLWHEGWHVGLLILALRQNGHELSEEWEEANIWGLWRGPE